MNPEPTSYNLRKAAIRSLNSGDFKSAAELIIMAKEIEVKEMKGRIDDMKKNYQTLFRNSLPIILPRGFEDLTTVCKVDHEK